MPEVRILAPFVPVRSETVSECENFLAIMEVIGETGPKEEKKDVALLYVDLWGFDVPADGKWYTLISAIKDVNAVLEIAAEASSEEEPKHQLSKTHIV